LPKRYWWILATYIICQLSGLLSATPIFNFIPKNQRAGIWTVTSFLVALIIILILLLPERRLYRNTPRSSVSEAVKWSFIGIFFVYATNYLTGVLDQIVFKASAESENTKLIMELAKMSPYVILVIVIVGPILEEIIFRKIIFGQLYKKTNFWIAGIVSSLLFAFAHVDGHIIIYGSIGLVLSFLYWKTKRIVVSMVAHASMNAVVVLISFSPAIQKMIEEEQQRQGISFIAHFLLK
jgi:uncharacterized protein